MALGTGLNVVALDIPSDTIAVPFAASKAVQVGDLMYWASTVAKTANQQADGGTEAANQASFQQAFLGVAADQRLSSETDTPDRVIITDGIFDVSCVSSTFEVGDYVAAVEQASGDALENRKVVKTADASIAIGYAVKRYASATTTVRVRLISHYLPNTVNRSGLDTSLADDTPIVFGDGSDAKMMWSTADASNNAFVLALGDSNQALHVTDVGAISTDWNISATTHPNVYIHSNTTPATDYLRLGDHDGTSAYIDVVGGTTLNFQIAASTKMALIGTQLFIGDTANANVTTGLTINQGSADDGILALKSSDVTHGMTTVAETDSYGHIGKGVATEGGLMIVGLSEGEEGLQLFGYGGAADTTDAPTTTSAAAINITGGYADTTGVQVVGATGNLLNVRSSTNATTFVNEFVVKGDGELYSNQSATVGTFDAYDDALVCADLSYALSREYHKIVGHSREMLERMGILTSNEDGSPAMYSLTKMCMLTLCAVGQLGAQIKQLAERVGLSLPAPEIGGDLLPPAQP